MTPGKAFRFVRKRGWDHWPEGFWFGLGQRAGERFQSHLNFAGKYAFVNRSSGARDLLLVVAGYKPYLWSHTLDRVERFVGADIDVCLVSPGVESAELDELARRNGWSRLVTEANRIALAQNLAIARHDQARFIYKLDEDVFIAEGFFRDLKQGFRAVKEEGVYEPGFCSPVLNVNGFSYVTFLELLGLEEEYRREFGELRRAAYGVRIHNDGAAALWTWQRTLPLDEIAGRFSERAFEYSVAPHRFSISAILFERSFWDEIGGFRVVAPPGIIGMEEEHFCFKCLDLSRVMVVAHNVFAGHFSYGPQEATMRAAFADLQSRL